MKEYKIRTNSMDIPQKELVQKAFQKLGYYWASGQEYFIWDCDYITLEKNSEVYQTNCPDDFEELTFKQLMQLANMEEFMEQKTFTKSDLKDGMVVKYRGGCTYSNKYDGYSLVVVGNLIQAMEFNRLGDFHEDLTSKDYDQFDIVEVFEVLDSSTNLTRITYWELKSLWKRPDPISAQQQAILELIQGLEAKQQELIVAAKVIAADIAKLKGV